MISALKHLKSLQEQDVKRPQVVWDFLELLILAVNESAMLNDSQKKAVSRMVLKHGVSEGSMTMTVKVASVAAYINTCH